MPMLRHATAFVAALACLTGCGGSRSSSGSSDTPGSKLELRHASIGRDGYATILDAKPAPFTPAEPTATQPRAPTPEQLAAQQQFARVSQFQSQVREEVEALAARLRAAEKHNFVDLYFENQGEPRVVFQFLRDGRRTLARYTHNPRFIPTEVRYSAEQLRAAMDFMMKTFREDRVIQSSSIATRINRTNVEINVPAEQFWALTVRKKVEIPGAVNLEFRAQQAASAVNLPLRPEIARLVRIFPRYDRPVGPIELVEDKAKIVLVDGCFRLADHGNALALLPFGQQLFVDAEGYLAFGSGEAPGYARVGEEITVPGIIHEITAPALVEPIHQACGRGQVLQLNGIGSAAAAQARYVATTNDNNLRQLQTSYGLSKSEVRLVFEACKRQNGGICLISPPAPMRREDCPRGTSFISGSCRTQRGYLRPLPPWIEKVLRASARR